ncbi:glycine cleavage system protein GcvH [Candidatus Poriferisocius sp.]|uniref:glycine cleavage system protein GcvH n=1 Tax=Candidatus Poriferisocius sp. TaxID=3101276 RepID=UPI003B02C1AB
MNVPAELRYSEDHEWTRVEGTRIFLGITDYAQDALGDVVYIDLPPVGTEVARGDPFSEVESTKSVSEIYAPVSGTVVEVNTDLIDNPERLNDDPYGEGWICVIEASDLSELEGLMDSAAYTQLTEIVN